MAVDDVADSHRIGGADAVDAEAALHLGRQLAAVGGFNYIMRPRVAHDGPGCCLCHAF